jgi:hypothetical protein
MYLKYILNKSMGEVLHVFACIVGLIITGGSMNDAEAQVTAPTMKYANPNYQFPSTTKFDLLATDIDVLDDCNPDLLGTAEPEKNKDVILLSKLDVNPKSPAVPAASAKEKNAAATVKPQQNVETFPVLMPQSASIPAAQETWEIIVADKTLNGALARWASKAGWQLLWELPVDYAVEAKTTVRGSFEEAVGTVAKSMESAEIPMKAMFYQGNKVLRIMAKGAE